MKEEESDYLESSREEYLFKYDSARWQEVVSSPVNTLQLFITNRCNLRCKGCFYSSRLGKAEMDFEQYKENVDSYAHEIKKVILLGGEPTLHPNLERIIDFNQKRGLKTTVYTNGANIERLEGVSLENVSVRIGVYGASSSEKPLNRIKRVSFPVDIVYMLRKDNIQEFSEAAKMAEGDFKCDRFYISSIRDIEKTGSFWKDTDDTLSMKEYARVVQNFVDSYPGHIPSLHIARRGILYTENSFKCPEKCRFGNIFPDNQKIICPFDIALNLTTSELKFNSRKCNKNKGCILTKIVLQDKSLPTAE